MPRRAHIYAPAIGSVPRPSHRLVVKGLGCGYYATEFISCNVYVFARQLNIGPSQTGRTESEITF